MEKLGAKLRCIQGSMGFLCIAVAPKLGLVPLCIQSLISDYPAKRVTETLSTTIFNIYTVMLALHLSMNSQKKARCLARDSLSIKTC